MKIKKNLTLISLMFGVMMLVSLTGVVSAETYGPVGPNYAECTRDTGGSWVCTTNVKYDDYSQSNSNTYANMEGEEEVQGQWNWATTGIPKNAVVGSVKVYVQGIETDPNVDANIQLWSSSTDQSLTEYQSFDYNQWNTKTFQDLRLTNEVKARILAGENIKLEVDFEGSSGCNGVKIDYVWLEIQYTVPVCVLTVTNPVQGTWFDSQAVPIKWTLSPDCTPIDYFYISYKKDGNCNDLDHDWLNLTWGANGEFGNPYSYLWDRPLTSGQYCVKVKVTSNGARDASEVFNVDLAPPEVDLSVGNPQIGDCTEGTGTCYVTQQTPITLTCADGTEPWQSDVDYMQYRYSVDGGAFTAWKTYEGAFNFPEDTNHVLEYRCFDIVGKGDTESKNFVVDSVGPEFVEKIIGNPKYCEDELCETYVTQDTEICVSYEDPIPHPVDDITVHCSATVRNTLQSEPYEVQIALDEDGCFTFGEDSYHSLYCWAEDALDNHDENEDLVEQDIVDTVAPVTTLGFERPHYGQFPQWIDTISNVTLTAEDPQPHPVGLDKTFYRYEQVDDSWCYGTHKGGWQTTSTDDESWVEYSPSFGLPESCHLIEYYSVDALGNTEVAKQEFVFVDKTAPKLLKEVGKPSSKCGLFNNCGDPIWNWYENPELDIAYEVTLNTPITISCEDQGNHPSGVGNAEGSGIWYRVVLDGKYDESSWVFVHSSSTQFWFPEQSEHLLEFYCVDNVGKISETDSELFKVTGTAFTLQIGDKWDLISVPFQLIGDGDVEDVFDDSKIVEVWSYEGGEWKVYSPSDGLFGLDTIVPGRGYWVKTTDGTTLTIGGSLMEPASLPPSVELDKGWNLIGHYDLSSRKAYCSLFSLVDTQQGFPRWSALWGYNSASQTFMPLTQWDYTNPGRGYWLEMDVEDSYSPSSICYGFS